MQKGNRKRLTLNNGLQPYRAAVTIASSGGLFFSLENLIAETDKGDNEYPELNEFL